MQNQESTKERITTMPNNSTRTLQASDIVSDWRQLEQEMKTETTEAREEELEDIRGKEGKEQERGLER